MAQSHPRRNTSMRPFADNAMARMLATLASPGGKFSRLTILMYHRVLPKPDPMRPLDITAEMFTQQMARLSEVFRVLPLEEALTRLGDGTLPARALCMTFDDGYRDNHDVAVPILKQFGMSATIFVATGFMGSGRMFNDTVVEAVRRWRPGTIDLGWLGLANCHIGDDHSRFLLAQSITAKLKYLTPQQRDAACERLVAGCDEALPDDLMMTPEQITRLDRSGIGIGGHTVSHTTLTTLSEDEARVQIETNRDHLTALMREAPRSFAYPNGRPHRDFTDVHARLVREAGYESAVSTGWGQVGRTDDRFNMRRCGTFDVSARRFAVRLLVHG